MATPGLPPTLWSLLEVNNSSEFGLLADGSGQWGLCNVKFRVDLRRDRDYHPNFRLNIHHLLGG